MHILLAREDISTVTAIFPYSDNGLFQNCVNYQSKCPLQKTFSSSTPAPSHLDFQSL